MKNTFILSLVCLLMTSNVFAQSEERLQEMAPSNEMAAILLANDLAMYGYQNNSASSLIEAASILTRIPTRELAVEKKEEGEKSENETTKAEKPEFTPESLLADAKELAAGNATLLAMISSVEKTLGAQTRGAVGGPQVGRGTIYANSYIDYFINFIGGHFAEVAVVGDGDTVLDLYIYDQNGNLITSDTRYLGNAYVSWYPRWTGTFRIRLVNRGNVYNNFGIATN
jgi:hypothetical protein